MWEEVAKEVKKADLHRDQTFREFLNNYKAHEVDGKPAALAYVQGFNAASADRISLQWLRRSLEATGRIDGDTPYRILQGYDAIVRDLSGPVELNQPVRRIDWKPSSVRVHTPSDVFEAERAIVTLPLSILQAAPESPVGVRFVPEIPEKRTAAERLAMGAVVKVIIYFDSMFGGTWSIESEFPSRTRREDSNMVDNAAHRRSVSCRLGGRARRAGAFTGIGANGPGYRDLVACRKGTIFCGGRELLEIDKSPERAIRLSLKSRTSLRKCVCK